MTVLCKLVFSALCLISALSAALFFLTLMSGAAFAAAVGAFFAAVLFAICRFSSKKGRKPDNAVPFALLVPAVFFLFISAAFPPFAHSAAKWRYPFQRAYIALYGNIKEPEEFRGLPEDAESRYEFDYLPSMLQGTGHYSVTYKTSPARAAEYAAGFASEAQYMIPLEEYKASDIYYIGEPDPAMKNVLDVYVSESMKSGCSDKAQIYVLSAVLNFNHPHSTCVIVDTETGMIQLSQLG